MEWYILLCLLLILLTPWITKFRVFILRSTFFIIFFYSWIIFPYWKAAFQKDKINIKKFEFIEVFYFNLNSHNQNKNLLISYLKGKNPDFVFLLEVNIPWIKEVKELISLYPYSKIIVREGNFGMAVLSKTLLEVENVFVDRVNMIPALFLKTKSSIGMLNLILLHAHPPIGKYGTMVRDQYLDVLSRRIAEVKSPLLVCGDFNTTPWSYIFQKFLENSYLKIDYNYLTPNTWPNIFFIPILPIDHCLSKGLKFIKYKTGPDLGSDHLPLITYLQID